VARPSAIHVRKLARMVRVAVEKLSGLLVLVQAVTGDLQLTKLNEHCGHGEVNVEFVGRNIASIPSVSSAALCCLKCKEMPQCRIWMWGKPHGVTQLVDGGDNVCTLRSADEDQHYVQKVPHDGVISGLPFAWVKPQSIFCFALMQPVGYERGLMEFHYKKQWGVFGCDEYQVISNQSLVVGQGVTTSVVNSDLVCQSGGEFGTALNTELFLQVWRVVFDDARFQYNDWTVKLDPDCVFFPQRLRVLLAFHPDTFHGVYLNNCKFGLHGPVEILSKMAVRAWAGGMDECTQHFNEVCSGPCLWGEDMFLDQCLKKVLKVKRVDDWNILSEDHCDSHDWQDCKNHRVAFHPFKSVESFSRCVENADNGDLPLLV